MADISITDALTGEVVERDYTADELAQREKDLARYAAIAKANEAKAKAKADVIAKLGLTADELTALLS